MASVCEISDKPNIDPTNGNEVLLVDAVTNTENVTNSSSEIDLCKLQIEPKNVVSDMDQRGENKPDMHDRYDLQKKIDIQLDFEAEDGDDVEANAEVAKINSVREELEEGECSDRDDPRPCQYEPRPVCRFYSRGQCTWGANCRFIHPGVTDKGNYCMFALIRPIIQRHNDNDYAYDEEELNRETSWERGLRNAKEMMKKASKRKENDADFEDKKMNMSLGHNERPVSPLARMGDDYSSDEHRDYIDWQRHRSGREKRENKSDKSSSDGRKYSPSSPVSHKHSTKQRFGCRPRLNRADEWTDPWMRSKSPGRQHRRRISPATNYSTSSSTSESSDSSSDSSYDSDSSVDYKIRRDEYKHKSIKSHSPPMHKRRTYSSRRFRSHAHSSSSKRKIPRESRSRRNGLPSTSGSHGRHSKRDDRKLSSDSDEQNSASPPVKRYKDTLIKMTAMQRTNSDNDTSNSKQLATDARREELLKKLKELEDAIERKKYEKYLASIRVPPPPPTPPRN